MENKDFTHGTVTTQVCNKLLYVLYQVTYEDAHHISWESIHSTVIVLSSIWDHSIRLVRINP